MARWMTFGKLHPFGRLLERSHSVISICHDLDVNSIRDILPMADLTKMADN